MPIKKGLTINDRALVSAISLKVTTGRTIDFQFPPKFVSESKKSNWVSDADHVAYEEVKHYTGSSSRALTLEYEYLVTGGLWTIPAIVGNLRSLKEYFYKFAQVGGNQKIYPTVQIDGYDVIPQDGGRVPTFRMMDYSFTYSDTLITVGERTFPIHTKVSIPLELMTQIAPLEGGGNGIILDDSLPPAPVFAWY